MSKSDCNTLTNDCVSISKTKEYIVKYSKILIGSIVAGAAIGIGGTAYLAIENHVVGSFIFALGLLLIVTNGFNLFTGKLCYAHAINKLTDLIPIWIGNLIGCVFMAWTIRTVKPDLIFTAQTICLNKLSENGNVILLGFMCNVLIFFAVNGFIKDSGKDVKNCLTLILCIMAFILCGFEHCIANMYYLSVAGMFNLYYILLNTLGNFIGGYSISTIYNFLTEGEKA